MDRAKEYAFLLYTVLLAAVYAVLHDEFTATLGQPSRPEYFVFGKGLDAGPLRWAVARLAVRAALPVGLLGGAALLVANGPRRRGRSAPLGYGALARLALLPVATAGIGAGAGGFVDAGAQLGTSSAFELGVPQYRVWRFVIVWGIHAGSYAGSLVGILAVALVVLRRRRLVSPQAGAPMPIATRWPTMLLWGAGVLVAGYATVCLVARLGYRVLLYPAPPEFTFEPPPGAALLSLRASDGAPVAAVQFPPPNAHARTVVLFHGNGETMAYRQDLAEALHARGLGVVLAEYRGYGLSRDAGSPDEAGLYGDATAVLDELGRQGIGPERVALVGISLGTGVAAEMASRGRGSALILVSPYTSITAMAKRLLPFLPASFCCPDRFETIAKAPHLRLPTLVIHGDADEVVPFPMGREVAASIPAATLRVVRGGHHNDLFEGDEGRSLVTAIAEAANAR